MTVYKYSFSLTPPAPAPVATAPEPLHEYPSSEFTLMLHARWRPEPGQDDNTRSFVSDLDGAALIISVDFAEIADDQAPAVAAHVIDSRLNALRAASAGDVQVLQQATQPHASGTGLQLSFIADVPGEHVHLHLGYVTARKVLNFAMVCQPGRQKAIELFNATVTGFRPRLP
jgi:hypothetical protein